MQCCLAIQPCPVVPASSCRACHATPSMQCASGFACDPATHQCVYQCSDDSTTASGVMHALFALLHCEWVVPCGTVTEAITPGHAPALSTMCRIGTCLAHTLTLTCLTPTLALPRLNRLSQQPGVRPVQRQPRHQQDGQRPVLLPQGYVGPGGWIGCVMHLGMAVCMRMQGCTACAHQEATGVRFWCAS